ncbi:MAG: hypothetical protein KBF35_09050 [Saprospiraceae bacterium]|nr:hypothetical protein [Saprospiraceae bacterium]
MKPFVFSFLISVFFIFDVYCQDTTSKIDEKKPIFGLGVHRGYFAVDGDIEGGGFGAGIRFQIPVNTIFSLRANTLVNTATGISYQPWHHSSVGNGGLIETVYEPYKNNQEGWFPSYNFLQVTIEMEGIFSIMKTITKVLDSKFDFFDLYILGSYGFSAKQTKVDLLDQNGLPYTNLITRSGFSLEKANTRSGRNEIKKNLMSIYDNDYETEIKYKGISTYSYGAGLLFNVHKRVALGLEQKIIVYPGVDYIDGIRFRTSFDQTLNSDKAIYTNLFIIVKI